MVHGQQRACMPVYIGKSGNLVGCYRCLTHSQTTEYRATQLVSSKKFKLSHAMTKTNTKTKKGARARWGSNNCAGGHIRFDKRMYTMFLKQTRFLDFNRDCQNCKSSNVAKI